MKTFEQYIKDKFQLDFPKGNVPGTWFTENGFPIVVRCTCCDMTMVIPSALIDDDGYTYCADCANIVS